VSAAPRAGAVRRGDAGVIVASEDPRRLSSTSYDSSPTVTRSGWRQIVDVDQRTRAANLEL
jgi:hypothetical protein